MKNAGGNFLEASEFLVCRIKELANDESPFMKRLQAHENDALLHVKITTGGDEQFHNLFKIHLRAIESIRRTATSCDAKDLSLHALRLLVLDTPTMIYLQAGRDRELRDMVQRMLTIHIKNKRNAVGVTTATTTTTEFARQAQSNCTQATQQAN